MRGCKQDSRNGGSDRVLNGDVEEGKREDVLKSVRKGWG